MESTGTKAGRSWLTPGVLGIGPASFLADAGHEIPTAILPSFLTATLGAPAAALGLIGRLVETGENAAVAALAPAQVRGSAFGVLAATQGFGQLVASALAGLLWTAISPMKENVTVFDFELSADEIASIDALDKRERGRSGPNPDTYEGI